MTVRCPRTVASEDQLGSHAHASRRAAGGRAHRRPTPRRAGGSPRRPPVRRPGCRRRSSGSPPPSGLLGAQAGQVLVDDAADQARRAVHAAAAADARSPGSGRSAWRSAGAPRTPARRSAGVRSGSRTRASASATVVSGASTTGSEVIRPPAVFGRVAQQPSHILGVLGVHPAQELFGVGRRHRPEQVGGVVGIHRLQHVGGALGLQLAQHRHLLVLGQLLQHVGEAFVIEGADHLVAPFGGQLADRRRRPRPDAGPGTARAAGPTPWSGMASPTASSPATCCQSTDEHVAAAPEPALRAARRPW